MGGREERQTCGADTCTATASLEASQIRHTCPAFTACNMFFWSGRVFSLCRLDFLLRPIKDVMTDIFFFFCVGDRLVLTFRLSHMRTQSIIQLFFKVDRCKKQLSIAVMSFFKPLLIRESTVMLNCITMCCWWNNLCYDLSLERMMLVLYEVCGNSQLSGFFTLSLWCFCI